MLNAETCLKPLGDCGFVNFSSNRSLTYLVPVDDWPNSRLINGVYVQCGSDNSPGTSNSPVVLNLNLFSAIKSAEYKVNQKTGGEERVVVNNQPIRGKSFSRHKQPSGDTASVGVSFESAEAIQEFIQALLFEEDTFNLEGEYRDPLKGSLVETLLTNEDSVESVIKLITAQLDELMGQHEPLLSQFFLSSCQSIFADTKSNLSMITRTLTVGMNSTLTPTDFKQGINRLLALYCMSSELIDESHLVTSYHDNNPYWSKLMPLFRSMILLFVARYDSFPGVREKLETKLDFKEICRLRAKLDIPNSGYLNIVQLGLLSDRRQAGARGLIYDEIRGIRLIDQLKKVPIHSKTGKHLDVEQWYGFCVETIHERGCNSAIDDWYTGEGFLSLGIYINAND